jgi:conjugative transfer region protein (TIGR03750 family)
MIIQSSKNLSRPPIVYKGLTKNETFAQAILGTLGTIILSVLVGMIFGYIAMPIIIGGLIGAILSCRVFPKFASRLKGELPSDTFIKKIRLQLSNFGFGKNPYIQYQGTWIKSKKVKR